MNADAEIERLATRQHGLVTYDQALASGLSADMVQHRIRGGHFDRLEPRVYRLAGAPVTWHQLTLAACLTESAVAFGRTAAALHEFDGFRPRVIEVVTDRWKRRVNSSVRVHESTDLADVDRTERAAIPVTTVERSLIDLGAVVSRQRVEQAFDDALRRNLTTPEEVRDRFIQVARRGRRGVGVIRPLLEERLGTIGPRPGEFERRTARLLTHAGLLRPAFEYVVAALDGAFVARVDLAYPPWRIAIECDSHQWHSGRQRRQADLARQNRLVLAGWTILRFTWEDVVHRPHLVVAMVRRAIATAA